MVPPLILLHFRDEAVEFRHTAIFFRRAVARRQRPKAGATDHAIARGLRDIAMIGQRHGSPTELRVALHLRATGRGIERHGGLASGEACETIAITPAIHKGSLTLHFKQHIGVLGENRRAEVHLGIQAFKAIGLGGKAHIMDGRHLFKHHPGRPGGADRDFGGIGRLDLLRGGADFGPGLGQICRGKAGLLESLQIDPEHRGRRIMRHGNQAALRIGIIAAHTGQIALRVQRNARFAEQFMGWADRGAGGHHGGGADFKHLRNVRRRAGAPGGDGAGHDFHIRTAEIGIHAKARLAFIEAGHLFGHALTKRPAQPIPELDFGAALGAHGRCNEGGREQTRSSQQNVTTLHESSPFLLRHCPIPRLYYR